MPYISRIIALEVSKGELANLGGPEWFKEGAKDHSG